jgi:DNA-binding CsgD family transcriptional regulator
MARQRRTQIQESLDFLQSLEQHYKGEPVEARIRVLRILKEDPSRTLELAARLAGCSERSVYRWWSHYQARGIEGILSNRRSSTPAQNRIGRNEVDELKQMLQTGELATLHDVQSWLETRFGVRYSLKGVANLLQRRLKARRVWIVSEGGDIRINEVKTAQPAVDGTLIPDKVLHFLNRMPLTNNTERAVESYRDALSGLLGEVDRVSIFVNIRCDLQDPETYQPGIMVALGIQTGDDMYVSSFPSDNRTSEMLLENLRSQGLPLENYHTPIPFDYYYYDRAYLGTIFLWRERSKQPISQRVHDTVKLLEPFIIYMLSDLIARYNYAHPIDRLFYDALHEMQMEAGLSVQERRVVAFRLLGLAYKEIADKLNISEDAIKKHLGSVHRKTGTRSYTELFAKYFTPRLNIRDV